MTDRRAAARERRKQRDRSRRRRELADVSYALPHGASSRAIARFVGFFGAVAGVVWLSFESTGVGMIATGVALVVAGIGMRSDEELAASIAADPRTGAVTLATQGGRAVTLPRSALLRARAVEHTSTSSSADGSRSTSTSWVLCLQKKDGGVLELGSFGDQAAAREIAGAIEEVLQATESQEAAACTDSDPLERLANCPLVEARREQAAGAGYRDRGSGDEAVVSWPASAGSRHLLSVAMLLCGMLLAPTGFVVAGASKGFLVLTVLFGAFGVLFGWSLLRDLGVRIQVRVAQEMISVERRRGERTLSRKQLPLEAIEAIDVSHHANVRGGAQLAIRLDEAQRAQLKLVEGTPATDAKGVVATLRAAYDVHQGSVQVPVSRLALPDQIALDLALSEEVARRTANRRTL